MTMHVRRRVLAALLATQCVPSVDATPCTTARINGNRMLAYTCDGGECGEYRLGDGVADLGFGGSAPDYISFGFYSNGGTPPLGSFDLASDVNDNYATCEQCILVLGDSDGEQATRYFFQSSGSLIVAGEAPPGSAMELTLIWSNLTLVEVTIDPETFASTPVPNGACYDVLPEVVYADGFDA
jgi:hypothetical protein